MDISQELNAVVKAHHEADEEWDTDPDPRNTMNDWASFISTYVARAAAIDPSDPQEVHENLIMAAALALNAAAYVREGTMPPRHYD